MGSLCGLCYDNYVSITQDRSQSLNTAVPSTAGTLLPARHRLWLALILGSLSALGALSIDTYLPAMPGIAGSCTPAGR